MKKRSFHDEYIRRKERNLARGYSLAQSRGHPKPGERLLSGKTPRSQYDPQLESAVKQIRRGKSLSQSAKNVGVSAERVRSYLSSQQIGEKEGGRWRVGKDSRVREIPIYEDGETRTISVRGYENARLVGEYLQSVKRFLETNEPSFLQPYVGVSVRDANGKRHAFETDPNTLYRLASGSGDDFSRIYRIQL